MATIVKPPTPLPAGDARPSVFLAGSIDLGAAEDWQRAVEVALAPDDVIVLNPRRDDWDAGWKQSITDPRMVEQVTWELDAQDRATCIAMFFAPASKAPITLLELGLFARSGRLVVCCPDGFWRRGNVEIVCARYGVPMVDDLDALVAAVRARLLGATR